MVEVMLHQKKISGDDEKNILQQVSIRVLNIKQKGSFRKRRITSVA